MPSRPSHPAAATARTGGSSETGLDECGEAVDGLQSGASFLPAANGDPEMFLDLAYDFKGIDRIQTEFLPKKKVIVLELLGGNLEVQ
jgi:hypothetical protein